LIGPVNDEIRKSEARVSRKSLTVFSKEAHET